MRKNGTSTPSGNSLHNRLKLFQTFNYTYQEKLSS